MKQVSEFLTGRIALVELCPLFMGEIEDVSQDDLWLMGGFPDGGILRKGQFPEWQQNYLDLLAMRDLPSWGLPAKPSVTKRFFKMVAAAHGTLWNASQLGKSMGLSYHTINTYLDYLEQTYLIRRLQPFSANIRKRLVKSPKVYWRDSGLLHTLLNTFGFDNLIAQPWVGHSWEGWVIEQILAELKCRGLPHEAYFLRTSDGHEIDLVLIIDGVLWAFEIKLSAHVDRKDLKRLNETGNLIGANRKVLLSRSEEHMEGKDIYATNLKRVIPILLR
jgi:predicted AAA+ superfamily ATPase